MAASPEISSQRNNQDYCIERPIYDTNYNKIPGKTIIIPATPANKILTI